MTITNRPLRVFLCHSSNDKPVVRELYQKLHAEVWIQPWLDEEELHPGETWEMEIEKAVESSDAVLVCLSNNSINKRGYVQKELRFALDVALEMPEESIFIIPLRLEECIPPRSLREWQYADYFEGQRERALERLLISLRKRAESLNLHFEKPKLSREDVIDFLDQVDIEHLNRGEKKPSSGNSELNKLTLSDGTDFMRVPAGKFLMGSKENNKLAYDDEKPQHTVDIPYDYWMARFPVTNELYSAYVKAKGIKHPVDGWEKKKDHPVVYVKWTDAMEYCQWLNDLRRHELPSDLVLRLPTEAEWEKAARGVYANEWPWGNSFDRNKCNSSDGRMGGTTPVDMFSPQGDSPFGCVDMVGNVWEWTYSLFKPYPYQSNDGREDKIASGRHVLRGGSFFNERSARCAIRVGYFKVLNRNSGFRVVVSLNPSER